MTAETEGKKGFPKPKLSLNVEPNNKTTTTSDQSNLTKGRIAAAHGGSPYTLQWSPFPRKNCPFPWGI